MNIGDDEILAVLHEQRLRERSFWADLDLVYEALSSRHDKVSKIDIAMFKADLEERNIVQMFRGGSGKTYIAPKSTYVVGSQANLAVYRRPPVPALNRVVCLNQEQIEDASTSVSELIRNLESHNGDPENIGLRERAIHHLVAARELLQVGQYKAYIMYDLLVTTLYEIVAKYNNKVIVALANAVLGAVVSKLI